MEILYYLATLLALVAADGYYYESPATLHWNPLHSPSLASTHQYQYHTQDGYGQYSYGYGEPLSTKQEVRTLDGITRGSYTYLDATGKLQTVAYTADANGFHVAASNLPKAPSAAGAAPTTSVDVIPQPVQETAEVAAARMQHLAAYEQAKLRLYQAYATPANGATVVVKKVDGGDAGAAGEKRVERIDILPQPVVDTPEVAAAKAEFFKRYEEVKQRNLKLQQQKQAPLAAGGIGGHALVKSQPINIANPLATYKPIVVPNGVFHFRVAVPSTNPDYYLPFATSNL